MKVLAVLLAAVWLAGTGLASLLVWFVATFPFENTTSDNRALGWVLLGGIAFVFAALNLAAVAGGRRKLALGAYAVHIVAALVLLALAFEDSGHNGTLVVFALAVEFAGVTWVLLSARAWAHN